ncbi:MAG: hypothetical protein ABR861_14235 [Terriglobales bacterium]|jgi:hypothetical protein
MIRSFGIASYLARSGVRSSSPSSRNRRSASESATPPGDPTLAIDALEVADQH